MEKKICPIHRYCYVGIECPICGQERIQKMALRWASTNMGVQRKRVREKKHKSENMDEMLDKLKQKFNSR